MTVQEIQTAINDKNWKAFDEDRMILSMLKDSSYHLKDITITSAFIQEYFVKLPRTTFDTYWIDDTMRSLVQLYYSPTLDDLNAILEMLHGFEKANNLPSYFEGALAFFTNAEKIQNSYPKGYYKLLMDWGKKWPNLKVQNYNPSPEEMNSIDDDVKEVVVKVFRKESLNDGRKGFLIKFLNDWDLNTILTIIDKELLFDLLYELKADLGGENIFRHAYHSGAFDFEDIKNWLDKCNGDYFSSFALGYLSWAKLDENQVEELIQYENKYPQFKLNKDSLKNLTKEQYKRLQYDYPNYYVLATKDGTLEDVAEGLDDYQQQRQSYYVKGMRFFTEEEIASHPNFFNPAEFKYGTPFYVSRNTFKEMNKAWGKRQRYNTKLTDFKSIMDSNRYTNYFTKENLLYLIDKTNVSNEQLVKFFSSTNSDPYKQLKLDTLFNFLGDK